MPELFESTSIKNLVMANRFVRSATWEGMATKGGLMKKGLLRLSAELARGGVGLIISGHAYVSPEGQATPFQLAAASDRHLQGLSEMAKVVHDEGGKILLQISHAGCFAQSHVSGFEPMGHHPQKAKPDL